MFIHFFIHFDSINLSIIPMPITVIIKQIIFTSPPSNVVLIQAPIFSLFKAINPNMMMLNHMRRYGQAKRGKTEILKIKSDT